VKAASVHLLTEGIAVFSSHHRPFGITLSNDKR
jgi:hypothetical protein